MEEPLDSLWDQVVRRTQAWVKEDLDRLRAQDRSAEIFLGREDHHGRWSGGLAADSNHLYFIRDSFESGEGLSRLDLKSGQDGRSQ